MDGNTWTYILGSNGSNMIWLNGVSYARITLHDIEMPVGLPTHLDARMYNPANAATRDIVNVDSADCLNYPVLAMPDSFSEFRLQIGSNASPVDIVQTDLECVGGTIATTTKQTDYIVVYMLPDEQDKVMYLKNDGYIVFVANYS